MPGNSVSANPILHHNSYQFLDSALVLLKQKIQMPRNFNQNEFHLQLLNGSKKADMIRNEKPIRCGQPIVPESAGRAVRLRVRDALRQHGIQVAKY